LGQGDVDKTSLI
jgi:hypothetical protein